MTQQELSNQGPPVVGTVFGEKSAAGPAVQLNGDEEATLPSSASFDPNSMAGPVELVLISSLVPGDSPRQAGEDLEHIRTLAESPSKLPPIVVHRGSMRVIDGMHRLQAAMLRGQDEIEVRFFNGDENDAFVFAVQANIAHGLPLSSGDRRAAAERIIGSHPEWSDRAVSMVAGLSAKRVAEIRLAVAGQAAEIKRRLGRDGRCRPVSGTEGRLAASELIRKDPEASLREIAREAGISPATVADVRARMARGEDPVTPKQRSIPKRESGAGNRNSQERPTAVDRKKSMVELTKVIESLKRDPSLRFNESGRILLRIFDICVFAAQKKQQIIDNLPAHQVVSILEILHACTDILQEFVDELQDKRDDDSADVPVGGRP